MSSYKTFSSCKREWYFNLF